MTTPPQPSGLPTNLIEWSSIAEQPRLWQHLQQRLQTEPLPSFATLQQPLWLVGEGSSYHVLQWVITNLGMAFTWPAGVRVFRPRELQQALFQYQQLGLNTPEAPLPFIIGLTQSGYTRTLHEAVNEASQRLSPKETPLPYLEGFLLTNHPHPETLTSPLQERWGLGAGTESCVAALKTVTGFYALLEHWLCALLQHHQLPVGKRFQWQATAEQATQWLETWQEPSMFESALATLLPPHQPTPPWMLLAGSALQPLLAEMQLKLLETTHHLTQFADAETFKHGYKAVLAPQCTSLQPVLVYVCTPCEHQAQQLVVDATDHALRLTTPIPQVWLGDATQLATFVLPTQAVRCGIPKLAGVSSQLGLLLWVQCLAFHANQRLGLGQSNLTKFVG